MKKKLLYLNEAITSASLRRARQNSELVIPLGRRRDGEIEVLDFCRAGNLLVAGMVDSGKTEFLCSVIASLAQCYQPGEVRLLLDDVTRVILTPFNGLPHLVRPVVVYLEESIEALHWLEDEAETRSRALTAAGITGIGAYNLTGKYQRMPHLVAVIYEVSDLMIGMPEIAEPIIVRLAQRSLEVGIYLIVATQRPATDVITSSLKASFATRACFPVASPVDSRTVLGRAGAEQLCAPGEMLYVAGAGEPRHLQAFFISDEEIDKLVSSLGNRGGD